MEEIKELVQKLCKEIEILKYDVETLRILKRDEEEKNKILTAKIDELEAKK